MIMMNHPLKTAIKPAKTAMSSTLKPAFDAK